MELAVSGTELAAGAPPDQLIELCDEAGVGAVELWHPQNTAAWGVPRTLSSIQAAGLKVACVSSPTSLIRPPNEAVPVGLLLEAIAIAAEAGATYANTYFGHGSETSDAAAISAYAARVAPCVESARELGVTIVLENEFDVFGEDPNKTDITRRPDSLRRLLETVDDPAFRTTFDPANFLVAGVGSLLEAYSVLRDFVAYVHVKDVRKLSAGDHGEPGYRELRDGESVFTTCPLGAGDVCWEDILAALGESGYDGFLSLEPHCQQSELAPAIRQATEYMTAKIG